MFNPDPESEFFYPRSRIQDQTKNLNIITQKIVSKLSEIWPGMFIPDPNLKFLLIPDPGFRGQKGIGSRSRDTEKNPKFLSIGRKEVSELARHFRPK